MHFRCFHTPPTRVLAPSFRLSARLQPGAQAKYGGVFYDMLRSSPALQMAMQGWHTVT